MNVHPKVQANAVGGGAGGLLAIIVVWVAQQFGLEVPAEIAVAFSSLTVISIGALAGYLKSA